MSDSLNQVILNFLDRMIDESVKNTDALSQLRSTIAEQRTEIGNISKEVRQEAEKSAQKIEASHNKNEAILREILDKINHMESEDEKKSRKALYKKIDTFIDKMKSPKTWFAIIASILIGLSGIIGGVATIVYRMPKIIGNDAKQVDNIDTNSSRP